MGNQLNSRIGPLSRLDPSQTVVLMIESLERSRSHPYHKQKLALVLSAMRHFKRELEGAGFEVHYVQTESFEDGIKAHLKKYPGASITVVQPADHGVAENLSRVVSRYGGSLNVAPDESWLSTEADWDGYVRGKKQLRMEFFYREMRRKTGWLMVAPDVSSTHLHSDQPIGGKWNYDAENRQVPERGHDFPPPLKFERDEITQDTLEYVQATFPDHFGNLELFNWPVTHADAQLALEHFLTHRLARFGPFEDAMVEGEAQVYHSLISPPINLGLLTPREVCERALEFAAKPENHVPLESIEGFIRQILGWREFMHHVYRTKMPAFKLENQLGHTRTLPDFYWTGDTNMRCVSSAVKQLQATGHTHHIQRLMVLGNFALIAGINPQEVNDWFLMGYVDAFDWVVTPNVIGMSQYADQGSFTSKPYASGAGYINRMSNHCGSCPYNPKETIGPKACPFASLYWDFVNRHLELFERNQRMSLIVAGWKKRDPDDKNAILRQAKDVLGRLEKNEL
jgi:deoxyribodipyrimidine photolyase-related protein